MPGIGDSFALSEYPFLFVEGVVPNIDPPPRMSTPTDNETWIIEAGDNVIQKKAAIGIHSLAPRERLIYCLWVADYGMRNADDLATASDLCPDFQAEAVALASQLSLPFTRESFALAPETLQQQYFQRFDRICAELKSV